MREALIVERRARDSQRWFPVWMAGAFVLIAFGGFAPTSWLQLPAGTFVGSPLLHLHGLLFSAWTLFLLVQTIFAARGRLERHRAWGLLGISLATAMVLVGFATADQGLRNRLAAGFGDRARAFHIASTSMIALFGVLVFAAIANVRRPEVHKRLMLLATVCVIPPAIARLFFAVSVGDRPRIASRSRATANHRVGARSESGRRPIHRCRHHLRLAHSRPTASRVPRGRDYDCRRSTSAKSHKHHALVVRRRGLSRALRGLNDVLLTARKQRCSSAESLVASVPRPAC